MAAASSPRNMNLATPRQYFGRARSRVTAVSRCPPNQIQLVSQYTWKTHGANPGHGTSGGGVGIRAKVSCARILRSSWWPWRRPRWSPSIPSRCREGNKQIEWKFIERIMLMIDTSVGGQYATNKWIDEHPNKDKSGDSEDTRSITHNRIEEH